MGSNGCPDANELGDCSDNCANTYHASSDYDDPGIDIEQDRFAYGFDAGQIIDGVVKYDETLKTHIVVDDDGVGYAIEPALAKLKGQRVRLTLVTMEAMLKMEQMLQSLGPG